VSQSLHLLPRLGIDVSKLTFDVCLIHADGSNYRCPFTNDAKGFAELHAWLAKHKAARTLAGLEATGPYSHALLHYLHDKGHSVCHLNPRRVKDFAKSQGRRVKTDAIDAVVIAAYLRCTERLQLWRPPCAAVVTLQALVRRRQQVMDAMQAERNRTENQQLPTVVTSSIKRQICQLKKEVAELTAAILKHVLQHPTLQKSVRLLCSIPGVGQLVAVTILSEVPHITNFSRAREVAAFAGLTPALAESGTSVRRRGHMTREGSALLRKMLYMAALQAVKRPTNALHPCYQAFVTRGKAKMCALGALMHKILRIAFGVLKHDTPFAPNLARLP
jgi:transposase